MSTPLRVVSLLPAATEIVCALGLEEWLVGRSHECDYPPSVKIVPAVTSTTIDPTAPSHQIDAQVKANGTAPVYSLDRRQLRELRPDIILTQTQCGVCAISADQLDPLLSDTPGAKPRVIALTAQRLADVWKDIQHVADALGKPAPGRSLIQELKRRCVAVIEQACQVKKRPTVACLEWLNPLMAAGNWVPELVELAGGQDICGEPGKHSDWLSWDKLRELDPSVLVIMPCGFDLPRTRTEWAELRTQASWEKLSAVRHKKVYLTDGNHFFNRPGPRLIDSLELLAGLLHPHLFKRPSEGAGWVAG